MNNTLKNSIFAVCALVSLGFGLQLSALFGRGNCGSCNVGCAVEKPCCPIAMPSSEYERVHTTVTRVPTRTICTTSCHEEVGAPETTETETCDKRITSCPDKCSSCPKRGYRGYRGYKRGYKSNYVENEDVNG